MSRIGVERKTRVLFACEQQGAGAQLYSALSKAPELETGDISGAPDEIFKYAVSKSADIVVLFFPVITAEHEKCVRRIMRGTYSYIMLLTDSEVTGEIASNSDDITVYRVSDFKRNIEKIVSDTVLYGKTNRRPSVAPASSASELVNAGDAPRASVLAEGALATKVVAVGASTGGTEALAAMFRGLRPPMPGIVVVQHMPPVFTEMFAQRLDRELPFDVFEARDNIPIKLNSIHIAPGDRHLLIKKVGSGFVTVLGDGAKVGGHCPAVNVLFKSVAQAAGSAATGVILTGMGGDGAEGMLEMRGRGSFTIGQDEKSCVVYGMPRKAFELGAVARQAPLSDIAGILMSHFGTV